MRSIGSILVLVGVISAVLKLFFPGVYHVFLLWVDNWGTAVGWCIRIGIILLGLGMMWLDRVLAARKTASYDPVSQRPPQSPQP